MKTKYYSHTLSSIGSKLCGLVDLTLAKIQPKELFAGVVSNSLHSCSTHLPRESVKPPHLLSINSTVTDFYFLSSSVPYESELKWRKKNGVRYNEIPNSWRFNFLALSNSKPNVYFPFS